MGLYDNIEAPDIPCPSCGKPLHGWQSKDGPCYLETLDFRNVDNFYTGCSCGEWVEFTRRRPTKITLDDYDMEHRKLGAAMESDKPPSPPTTPDS